MQGLGEYFIRASVPSPAVNVLCAEATEAEIAPMIYERWPGYVKLDPWPQPNIPSVPSWLNKTALDDVFGFGEKYNRRAPVFSKFPKPYNAVFNETINCTECDSVYVLVAPATAQDKNKTNEYTLCSLRVFLTPSCSTEYRATLTGGTIKSHCEDPTDDLAYHRTNSSAPDRVLDRNWPPVAGFWGYGIALDAGRADSNAAVTHILAQLITESATLDAKQPSIAEALAVLAGNTLLLSSIDSPFVPYWNQSRASLEKGRTESFKATIRSQDYASGGTQPWQNVFYLVLASIFALNTFCLIWFFLRNGYLTDFIEPQNLFALSLNSPPSSSTRQGGGALKGCCGAGPENREQLMTRWFINIDPDREHYYIQEGLHQPAAAAAVVSRRKETDKKTTKKKKREYELSESPTVNAYYKLSMRRNSIL